MFFKETHFCNEKKIGGQSAPMRPTSHIRDIHPSWCPNISPHSIRTFNLLIMALIWLVCCNY